jgi:Fe2+ or Zn2+ uptake regulation protein
MDRKKEIYDLLKNNGGRLTKQKKNILSVLLDNMDRMLSAGDIAAQLPEECSIDNTTVYRNVQQMTGLGILESMVDDKGINRYVIAKGGNHHHHLICVSCGRVFSIPCKNNYWGQYAKDNGFHELYHKLEVYGKCDKCKDSDESC